MQISHVQRIPEWKNGKGRIGIQHGGACDGKRKKDHVQQIAFRAFVRV